MNFFRKIIRSKHFWSLVVVTLFGVLASRTLLFQKGYFNMHDDLQMMRQLVMEQCFLDGQIPCRWTPHMGYGFGFPLFNYYPPLPYLVGEVFRLVGFSFVNTVKITFALSIILSGIAMYFLAGEFFPFGKKVSNLKTRFSLGAIVSAIFYIWAPYHAVDVYVRGAMNEAWALVWFPLLFWTSYNLISAKKNISKWFVGFALSYFGLFTSHNLMILIFTPVLGVWVLMWMWKENAWSRLLDFIKSGLLSFGLAAFFTLPVLLEKNLVHIETLTRDYFEYIAHFATSNQLLFSRYWGYGGSVWEDVNDGMSFSVGHLHWILSLVVGVWVAKTVLPKKKQLVKFLKKQPLIIIAGFLFALGWFSVFLAHSRSTFIWQLFKPLEFVQFPWRFLALSTFAFSFMAGMVPALLSKSKNFRGKSEMTATIFLIILIVATNWNYFLPFEGRMGPLADEDKFSNAAWELQQAAGILDYLPRGAKNAPEDAREYLAEIAQGKGSFSDEIEGTNWANFSANIETETATVRLGIFQYPNWEVKVDGKIVETYVDDKEKWGRMYFVTTKGEHNIELKLKDTAPRIIGNIISLVTWIGLITFPKWKGKVDLSKLASNIIKK